MSFQQLPEDLIEYVLMQLSPYGDLDSCRSVCRQWDRLAHGAGLRLHKLFHRCESFDWFLLSQTPQTGKFMTNVAERCSHVACYHSSLASMFVFGGCTAAYTTFNDLWRLDLRSRRWVRPIPNGSLPSPKACSTMVEHRGRLVLFGGWSKSSPNPIHQTAMFFNELHVYDPQGNDWRSVQLAGAPHLAGHSVSVVGDSMIVFGGSHGSGSSNAVWVFDFRLEDWFTPPTTTPKPLPRYGQSQVTLDDTHILVVGGCGGPNLIFADIWLLTISQNDSWIWEEIHVNNAHLAAPQIWSHPACKVGDKLVVLSKPVRSHCGAGPRLHRAMSSSHHTGAGAARAWVPPQGNLIPPRRKLISSRSLDEQEPPPSSEDHRSTVELQRARSIPTIIVGEIPTLVVTKDENSGDSSGSDSGNQEDSFRPTQCIAMVASSLLPNLLVSKNPMHVYLLDLSKVLSERTASWQVLEGYSDAPEDTILYSLVEGRAELIMFGGMRSSSTADQQGLDVTPFSHTITNETYILKPPISL